jgi:hypothetical protein
MIIILTVMMVALQVVHWKHSISAVTTLQMPLLFAH